MGSDTSSQSSLKGNVVYLLGGLIGAVLSGYFGFALLLVPGVTCVVVYLIARISGRLTAPFLHAVAIECGHVMWMIVGGIVTPHFGGIAIDVFVMGTLLIWLIAKASRPAAFALIIANTIAMLLGVSKLQGCPPDQMKALALHLALQFSIVVALRMGLRKLRAMEREEC